MPTHLIGNDAFQECDTVGITRPCTKHNWLVRDVNDLAKVLHEAFYVATTGRPGPVLVDVPKDVQFAVGTYHPPRKSDVHVSYTPRVKGDAAQIRKAVALLASAKRPVIYSGGGVINSGPEASKLLRELVEATGFPITSTLMGLGAYPATGKNWLGMLGMHGTYEANMAMHDCDVMLCVGARFDDRITGRVDAFSPGSKKIHIDIDPVLDQQEHPRRRADHRRRRQRDGRPAAGVQGGSEEARHQGRGGRKSPNGARAIRSPTRRTTMSSCRNTPSSACSRRRAAVTPTSRPKSASTRCGRRSSSASRSRTAG